MLKYFEKQMLELAFFVAMVVGWGVVKCTQCPHLLSVLLFSYNRKTFYLLEKFEYFQLFNETNVLFLIMYLVNFKYQRIFQCIDRSKNIKRCEFYVSILYRECREIAKKLWLW